MEGVLAAPVGVEGWEPLVGSLLVLAVPLPVAEAVGVGDWEVGDVLGLDDVVGLDGAVLPPPPDAGVVGSVLVGMPPCSVTTIPPGLNTIRAVHWPVGAALVAVAVTSRLCPAASVPEL